MVWDRILTYLNASPSLCATTSAFHLSVCFSGFDHVLALASLEDPEYFAFKRDFSKAFCLEGGADKNYYAVFYEKSWSPEQSARDLLQEWARFLLAYRFSPSRAASFPPPHAISSVEILDDVKRRHGFFIPCASIGYLKALTEGFEMAENIYREQILLRPTISEFTTWLFEVRRTQSKVRWEMDFLAACGGDENRAYECFFLDWARFLESRDLEVF